MDQSLAARTAELEAAVVERRHAETKYAPILETALSGFWISDMRGKFLEVNDAYCPMSGYTRDELLGMSVADVEADETAADILRHLQSLRRIKFDTIVKRHRRKDGTLFDAEVNAALLDLAEERAVAFVQDVTARLSADRVLKDSEERARALVPSAPIGIYEMALDGSQLLGVNDVVSQISGYTREEVLAMDPLDLLDEESRIRFQERIKKKLAGEETGETVEYRIQTKDGRRLDLAVNAAVILQEDGKPQSMIVIARDITARKEEAEAVRRTSERFKLLSEVSARLLGAENPQTIVDELCRAVMKHLDCQVFFNYLVDEPSGRLHLNGCAGVPEDSVRQIKWLDIGVAICGWVAEYGQRIIAEDIQNTQDARAHLVRSFGIQAYACHPLLAQGRVIGTLSFGTRTRKAFAADELELMKTVSDQVAIAMQRIRTGQQLAESEKRYRQIVETAREGILATDARAVITYVNQQAATMFGRAPEEMIGQSSLDLLVYPEDRDEGQARWQRRQNGLSDVVNEFRYRRRDGSPIWVMLSASPLYDRDGMFMGALAMMSDITERKRAEEKIRHQNAVLAGINQIFREALNCETEEELGRVCLTLVEQVTGSQFGFIGELNAEGRLDDIAISDPDWALCRMEKRIGHRVVPGGFRVHGIYGRVLLDGKGLYTNDPSSHPDSIGTPQGHPSLTAFLGVPLKHDGNTIGMLGVGNRKGGYRDEDLQVLEGMAPAIVQVLQQRRAEQALLQRNEELEVVRTGVENEKRRLEALMEALPVAVAILDARGGNIQSNSAFEQLWGGPLPPTESVEDYATFKAWWVDSGKPVAPEEWASAQSVQKGLTVVGQFLEIQRFDGSHAFVINSGSPVREASGKIIGSAVAIQDVTPLKLAEERIRNLNVDLETRARQVESANEELRAANQELHKEVVERQRAEESVREAMRHIRKLNADAERRAQELSVANEELERLAVSLAYDLRSPLVSINNVSNAIA